MAKLIDGKAVSARVKAQVRDEVALLKEKGVSIRESIAKKNIVIRWGIWYALILLIIVFGYTGGVQAFLYANF